MRTLATVNNSMLPKIVSTFALLCLCLHQLPVPATADRSFVIDYEGNQFLKDGKPFQMVGSAVHYYTIAPDYWEDRLTKIRAMGVNVIQVYVPWNLHEPRQGEYQFSGIADLDRFLSTANNLGLLVSMRPTPFIDSEWDMGGLPAWLLNFEGIRLRYSDPPIYIMAVKRWYDVLLPILKNHLYENGGPIVSAQIENEYGSYACDKTYTLFLRNLLRNHLGPRVILFTTDGASLGLLKCGSVSLAYATVDFGTASYDEVSKNFGYQRAYSPQGPLINSEFYPGWFDQWGDSGHHTATIQSVTDTVVSMWSFNASFTFYMGVGGTLWGYWAGAEGDQPNQFRTVTTSYDYDAPISEAGDMTPKFLAIRSAVEKHFGRDIPYPIPTPSPKANYGQFKLTRLGTFLDLLNILSPAETVVQTLYPVNVEQLEWYHGFTVYESVATKDSTTISIDGVHDRAYILLSGVLSGILQRPVQNPTIKAKVKQGDPIHILVENQGRICFGRHINDKKGLTGNVTLDDGSIVAEWLTYPLNISRLWDLLSRPQNFTALLHRAQVLNNKRITSGDNPYLPSFYVAKLPLPTLEDTFLNPDGWSKGQAFVNGHNLGRYWPVQGPQVSLYVPKPLLKSTTKLLLFELDGPGNCVDATLTTCSIEFVDKPIWKA